MRKNIISEIFGDLLFQAYIIHILPSCLTLTERNTCWKAKKQLHNLYTKIIWRLALQEIEAKKEKYRFEKGSDWISFPAFASVAFHPCAHFSNRAFCQIAFLFYPDNSFHSFYFYCILFHEIMHLVDIKVLKSDLDCSDCLYSCGPLFTRCCNTDAVWCLIWPILPTSPPLSTENKNVF